MACVFCTDLTSAGDLLLETDEAWVILHPDWSPRGHAMVVAKAHVENVSGLDEERWLRLAALWQRVERVLLGVTGMERAIILKLGIQTPHLHLHVYPLSSAATRDEVFAAFDGRHSAARDESFLAELRHHLTLPPR
jgi:diadenosine tetraphosphate (Ap4A) HIT family hydrolase